MIDGATEPWVDCTSPRACFPISVASDSIVSNVFDRLRNPVTVEVVERLPRGVASGEMDLWGWVGLLANIGLLGWKRPSEF